MEAEFRALLTGASSVTDIAPAASINFGENPQGTAPPYVVITIIGNGDGLHLTGRTGLFSGRVQVDCYATTPKAAITLSAAIEDLLQGYNDANFRLISHAGTRGPTRETGTNEAERLFRRSMDFITTWRAGHGNY